MWAKVSRNGREQQSGDGGASPFDRPGERRREGPLETPRGVSRISGSAQGHQSFYHHAGPASGSNLPDRGMESQRSPVREFRGQRGGGRAAGVAGESLRRRRGDRQIGTGAASGQAARNPGPGKTAGVDGRVPRPDQRG